MSKKKKMHNVQPKTDKKAVISGEELRKKTKSRDRLSFSTGKYMTEKDRPRKKRWSADEE